MLVCKEGLQAYLHAMQDVKVNVILMFFNWISSVCSHSKISNNTNLGQLNMDSSQNLSTGAKIKYQSAPHYMLTFEHCPKQLTVAKFSK